MVSSTASAAECIRSATKAAWSSCVSAPSMKLCERYDGMLMSAICGAVGVTLVAMSTSIFSAQLV